MEQQLSPATPEVAAVLRRAAVLVEAGWCQGAAARAADGCPCDAGDAEAVAWSAVGAIERAALERVGGDWHAAVDVTVAALDALAALLSVDGPPQLVEGQDELERLLALTFAWNDAEDRNARSVAAALHTAAGCLTEPGEPDVLGYWIAEPGDEVPA